ncbi:hypothetical protein H271_05170 [Vibrio parahaemolyticus 1911C]|nr:hypothetical protein H271_05170 [Vibrio parahaemolyticus 1911C]
MWEVEQLGGVNLALQSEYLPATEPQLWTA